MNMNYLIICSILHKKPAMNTNFILFENLHILIKLICLNGLRFVKSGDKN